VIVNRIINRIINSLYVKTKGLILTLFGDIIKA